MFLAHHNCFHIFLLKIAKCSHFQDILGEISLGSASYVVMLLAISQLCYWFTLQWIQLRWCLHVWFIKENEPIFTVFKYNFFSFKRAWKIIQCPGCCGWDLSCTFAVQLQSNWHWKAIPIPCAFGPPIPWTLNLWQSRIDGSPTYFCIWTRTVSTCCMLPCLIKASLSCEWVEVRIPQGKWFLDYLT